MKKTISKMIGTMAFLLSLLITVTTPVHAAKKPASPKGVKVHSGSYYDYWDSHRQELLKAGKVQGDGYDAVISWNKVKNAKGYRVTVYWLDDEDHSCKTVVTVKKMGSSYEFYTQGEPFYNRWDNTTDYMHLIAKNEKSFILNGSVHKFRSKKLSFQICGDGSCVWITKVKVKSYKIVKGKKIYSNATTKKVN